MGLNLRGILDPAPVALEELRGETVALDAYGLFYQFLTMLRDMRGKVLTDAHGNTTSHLIGLVSKTQELVEADILPVYVFDGKPHPLKLRTLEKRAALKDAAQVKLDAARAAGDHAAVRRLAGQTTYVTSEMVASAQALLDAAGLPYVMAPQDAEAQCAVMAANGVVDAAASQDYDTLVYGAPRVLRNLTSQKRETEEILFASMHMETGLTRASLIDIALLVGNDFHDGVKGIGAKTAYRFVQTHGGIDGFFTACANGHTVKGAAEKKILAAEDILTGDQIAEVRDLFADPKVETDVRVKGGNPDASIIHERLVEVHGFSLGRADSFGTAVVDLFERRRAGRQTKLLA